MKHKIYRIVYTALCCAPLLATAQTSEKITSPQRLYEEGRNLFQQKAFAAAMSPLHTFVKQINAEGNPLSAAGDKEEAEYMLVCAEYGHLAERLDGMGAGDVSGTHRDHAGI